jgi:hypothetical protein
VSRPDSGQLEIRPATRDVGTLLPNEERLLCFEIINHTTGKVDLVYIYTECDCTMDVPVEGTVPAGGKFALLATLKAPDAASDGELNEAITILTDYPPQKELRAYVHGHVCRNTHTNSENQKKRLP